MTLTHHVRVWLVTPQTGRSKTRTLQPLIAETLFTTSPGHTAHDPRHPRSFFHPRLSTLFLRTPIWSPGHDFYGLPKCLAPSTCFPRFQHQPYFYTAASLRPAFPDAMPPPLSPIITNITAPRASEDTHDGRRYSQEIESPILSPASVVSTWSEKKPHSKFRHTLGIILLLATVVLWTASNFLASVCAPLYSQGFRKHRES
jgi:hypothetical protein